MREAILAVSFGSTVDQARSRDLEGVEQALSAAAQRKRAAMTSAARTHTSPERVSRLLRCSSA